MDLKVATLFICCVGLSQAGDITSNYPPVASPVYTSFNPTIVKTVSSPVVSKTINPVSSSGPYYESIITTHESNQKSSDGSQHSSFSKTLDTTFSKVNKFKSRTSNDDVILTHSLPSIYSIPEINSANSVYHDTSHSQPFVYNTPIVTKTVSPISKKTEIVTPALTSQITPVVSPLVTKSFSTPFIYSSPIVTKTVTPVLNEAVVQTAPVKTGIAYSPTPLVAHASFNGLGTSK